MVYVMMIAGGVLAFSTISALCWALCKAKSMYEREQERSENNGKID